MITDTLFKWENWDAISDDILVFFECELIAPIGEFEAGATVYRIIVDFEHGYLQLFCEGGTLLSEHKVRLALVD
jgi:hypothetical protein